MNQPENDEEADDEDAEESESDVSNSLKPYALSHGLGLHPIQWVTSNFLHGNIFHLIGNMIFLWVFGIIVEGKLGWWKFLLLYLGLGIGQCASEQIVTLGRTEAYSIGASGVIFGLLAMTLVWAPKNDLHCAWIACVGFRIKFGALDLTILAFAAFYILMESLTVLLSGFELSSAMLHVTGVLWGLPVAVLMLRADWVDCENWDLFAVLEHRVGKPRPKKPKPESEDMVAGKRSIAAKSSTALMNLRRAIAEEHADAALIIFKKTQWALGGEPTEADLIGLIKLLHAEKRADDSIPIMEKFINRFPEKAPLMRLKLAEVLMRDQQRPGHALRVLAAIPPNSLFGKLDQARQVLERKAKQMREDGVLEIEGESW